MTERLSPEGKPQEKDAVKEIGRLDLPKLRLEEPDHDENGLSSEELMRYMAYHEAGHAVIYVMQGKSVREVSVTTEDGACVTELPHLKTPGGPAPLLWQSLDRVVAVLAGEVAVQKLVGQIYPCRTWEELVKRSKEPERWGDSADLENNDTIQIYEFCIAAALWGEIMKGLMPDEQRLADIVKMSVPDELPDGPPPLPQLPPDTPEEAFLQALNAAEQMVDICWLAIEEVAERLFEVGRLTGEEVEEILMNSGLLEEVD